VDSDWLIVSYLGTP